MAGKARDPVVEHTTVMENGHNGKLNSDLFFL